MLGVADQAMVSGANFACNIVLARALGLAGFGEFSLAWMGLLLVNALQDALVVYPMLSIGPKQPAGEKPAYFAAVLAHSVLLSGLAAGLIVMGLTVAEVCRVGPGLGRLALPLAGAGFTYLVQNALRYALFTAGRPLAALLSDATSALGKLLALVVMGRAAGLDVAGALVAAGVTSALAIVVACLMFEKVRWERQAFVAVAARHWHFGKWLCGSAVIRWADNDWYTWMAGGTLGVAAAGALKAAQSVTNLLQLFFAGLESVVAPRAAGEYRDGGKAALCRYMGGVGRWVGPVACLLIAALLIAPDRCLRLFYGDTYAAYGSVQRWLALAQGFYFLLFLLNVITRTIESTRVLLVASGLTVVFNILTSPLLLGRLGLEGAAIGQLCGRVVSLAVLLLALLPLLKPKPVPQDCARNLI